MKEVNISKDIINIGASDNNLKIFENQYVLKNGMSYNSYVIKDEKNVIMDTIDEANAVPIVSKPANLYLYSKR